MSTRFRTDGRSRTGVVIGSRPPMIAFLISFLLTGGVWSVVAADSDEAGFPVAPGPGRWSGFDSGIVILGENLGWPVWGNGRYLGRIPVRRDSLPAGAVLLEVGLPPEEAEWFRPWPIPAVLKPASVDTLHVEPLQRLRLGTVPAGARVWRDGEDFGRTPLNVLVPSTVTHDLSFSATGHASRQLTYDPIGRPDSLLLAVLIPHQRRDLPTIRSESPWIARAQTFLPVAAVILGGGGLWARHKADSAYEDYIGTVDRSRMSRNLDRAGKYDRMASAFWISAELCLLGAVTSWVIGSRRSSGLATGTDSREPYMPEPYPPEPPSSSSGLRTEEGAAGSGAKP